MSTSYIRFWAERVRSLCCVLLCAVCLTLPAPAWARGTARPAPQPAAPQKDAATPDPALHVKSAILINCDDGQILYEQNADAAVPPASLTKVLTMYMALQKVHLGGCSLDEPVLVSDAAANTGGSRMSLMPQERLPLDALLMGMAVASGNDASAAVAEFIGGTEQNFVQQMNTTAASLGMTGSCFHNPHGLPAAGQVTTARDMMRLAAAYMKTFPEASRYHTQRYMKHNGFVSYNKNPLLGKMDGADGLKTGWIRASGYNIISTAKRNGTRLLAVILGAESSDARARELYRLLEAGFTARQQQKTVAAVLPTIDTPTCDLSLDSTVREAYAVLAPELKGRIPLRRGYHRAFKGSRNYARAHSPRAYAHMQRMMRKYRRK